MKDQDKTIEQLIDELADLRKRCAEFKKTKAEYKKIEQSLEESNEKYKSIAELITDGIITFDLKGVVSSVNNSFLELTGFPRDKIVGTHFSKLPTLRVNDIPGYLKLFSSMIMGKIPEPSEFLWIHNDGTERWGEGYFYFLRRGRKKVGIQAILKDITERKQAEKEKEKLQAQLVQSEKMAGIGTLTSGIAHEFNNLLQIMSGHAEFAQRTKKPEDMEEALEIVGDTSKRVSKIIKDLLTFSRREPLERKDCDIAELVEFVLSMTEEQLKKHNIVLTRKYKKRPNIEVNEGEIQQVFLNMITNARDAMLPKGGTLEIGIKKVKDNVEISFTDTGTGIEKENLGKVFEPFYTTKGAVGGDSRIQGLGLGLSVSYGIINRHDGTIEVKSEVGKGTTFIIKLPLRKEETKKKWIEAEKKSERTKPKSLDILVVDDEPDICSMLTKWLSADGHKVKSVLVGSEAINLVKKKHYDVVFLDIVMPGISGDEVLVEIKEISSKIKVIMITGSLMKKSSWKELKQKGASGYIKKPFKMEDIKKFL